MEHLTSLLEYGILGAIILFSLVFLTKGITKGMTWLAKEILVPIKDHLIKHLDQTAKILLAIQKVNEDENKERQQMLRTLAEHTDALSRIDKNVNEIKQKANLYFAEQHEEYTERKDKR